MSPFMSKGLNRMGSSVWGRLPQPRVPMLAASSTSARRGLRTTAAAAARSGGGPSICVVGGGVAGVRSFWRGACTGGGGRGRGAFILAGCMHWGGGGVAGVRSFWQGACTGGDGRSGTSSGSGVRTCIGEGGILAADMVVACTGVGTHGASVPT